MLAQEFTFSSSFFHEAFSENDVSEKGHQELPIKLTQSATFFIIDWKLDKMKLFCLAAQLALATAELGKYDLNFCRLFP